MTAVIERPVQGIAASEERTRLRGTRLLAARSAWLALVIFALLLFCVGIPARVNELRRGFLGLSWARNTAGEIILSPIVGLPAAEAGIRQGDILLAVNGIPISELIAQTGLDQSFFNSEIVQFSIDVRRGEGTTQRFFVARDNRGLAQLGISPDVYARYMVGLDILLVAAYTALACIIFSRKSDEWFALLMSASLVFFAVRIVPEIYSLAAHDPAWSRAVDLFLVLSRTSVPLFLSLFPNGRFVPKWTAYLCLAACGYYVISLYIFGNSAMAYLNSPQFIIDALFIGTGVVAQIYRYRRVSNSLERQQTKWIVLGITIGFVTYYALNLVESIYPQLQGATAASFRFQALTQPLFYLALLMLPLTMTISILRYHLWEIDIIINRTLVYLPLTGILAGLFAATITFSQKLFVALTGQTSDIATVLTTLVVVAAFEPVKKALQEFVDRHFKEIPDPNKRLRPFCEMLGSRMFDIDPVLLARRAVKEAVAAFDAKGGSLSLSRPNQPPLVFTSGEWLGEVAVKTPLVNDGVALGELELSARVNGEDYTSRDSNVLHDFGALLGQTLAQAESDAAELEDSVTLVQG